MTNPKTASQILTEAADFVETTDRWTKNAMFAPTDNVSNPGCIMCAHGIIHYSGNPDIQLLLDSGYDAKYIDKFCTKAAMAEEEFAKYHTMQYVQKKYGSTAAAHYKAFKVGLSFNFNDSPTTTKQEVVAKLREAATLVD